MPHDSWSRSWRYLVFLAVAFALAGCGGSHTSPPLKLRRWAPQWTPWRRRLCRTGYAGHDRRTREKRDDTVRARLWRL